MSVGPTAEGQGPSDGVGGHWAGQTDPRTEKRQDHCVHVGDKAWGVKVTLPAPGLLGATAQGRFPRIPVDGER